LQEVARDAAAAAWRRLAGSCHLLRTQLAAAEAAEDAEEVQAVQVRGSYCLLTFGLLKQTQMLHLLLS
jgi:hypothetical protein